MLGVNRILAKFILGKDYEARYDSELSKTIAKGDCVWDIGANVGYYTRLFADRVGPKGRVFAFEPSAQNFERLMEACRRLPQVKLHPFGMGDSNGTMHFQQGADELGATSRIVQNATDAAGDSIEIRSGHSVLEDGAAAAPNIVKIDVEGFEWEVIQGLGELLDAQSVRAVGVEIHFRILKERNIPSVPSWIETRLKEAGFSVSWADPSHLLAVRS